MRYNLASDPKTVIKVRAMHRIRFTLVAAVVLALAGGCSSRSDLVEDEIDAGGKGVFTGLLHWSDPDTCPFPAGCGPEFSLIDESFSVWTPLEGDFDPAHHNLVVRVEGKTISVDRDHRAFLKEMAAAHAVKARRYRLLSTIPYHEFLVKQAGDFTSRKYGCELLWDKSFSWREIDGRIHLVVRMTDTLGGREPARYLELSYDGQTGHFLREDMRPWGINPCES
ncbi:MAG: hypothetical protein DWQ08_08330 [Proteobacteria bacterium]|nr:MAG: hypothetical protein DWQ08_08330 [Pseudomonadota bacterium]